MSAYRRARVFFSRKYNYSDLWLKSCDNSQALRISRASSHPSSLMASLSDLCTELADIHLSLQSEAYTDQVKGKMVTSVALEIVAHKGGHASGHTLMTTVQAMGLVEKYEAALKDAINQMLLADSPSGEANKGNADQQLLVSIPSYLTGQDWIRLEEPNSTPEQHINVLAGRVSSLGLRNFDEQTYKEIGRAHV